MTSTSQLPNGKQQFIDINGDPLIGGLVYHFVPGTTHPKNTWQDEGQTILNTNPVVLDARGQAVIFGTGKYRQVLKDIDENLIWDQLTTAPIVEEDEDTTTSFYDFPVYIEGAPSDGEVYPIFNIVRSLQLPATLTDSIFTVATLPTANTVFLFRKNGVSIGTVTFDSSGAATVSFAATVAFAAGDQFSIISQATADATAGDIAMTFVFMVL